VGAYARMAGTPTRHARSDVVLPQPACPRYRLAHIGFFSPGGPSRNKDKDKHGHRYDSVGICNGVIHAGASCVRFAYDPSDPERMIEELKTFDGYIVRINPGQLSNPGVAEDAQRRFDDADAKIRRRREAGVVVAGGAERDGRQGRAGQDKRVTVRTRVHALLLRRGEFRGGLQNDRRVPTESPEAQQRKRGRGGLAGVAAKTNRDIARDWGTGLWRTPKTLS
jgi:hypothetical protein